MEDGDKNYLASGEVAVLDSSGREKAESAEDLVSSIKLQRL
jgi:hypothetical protein